MTFSLTGTDYAILVLAFLGIAWVTYGVLKRVFLFLLLAGTLLAAVLFLGYFQTGRFSGGFFGERSCIVRFAGQLIDGYRQGAFR